MIEFAGTIGRMGIPIAVVLAGLVMLFGRKNYFDAFLRGARQGLQTAVGLLPTLCALVVAVCILNASGASELLSGWLSPVAGALGIPADLLPLLLTRPFSGSASMAVYDRLLQESGQFLLRAVCLGDYGKLGYGGVCSDRLFLRRRHPENTPCLSLCICRYVFLHLFFLLSLQNLV